MAVINDHSIGITVQGGIIEVFRVRNELGQKFSASAKIARIMIGERIESAETP